MYLENAKELNILDDVAESLNAKEKYTAHFEAAISRQNFLCYPQNKLLEH